MAKTKQAQIQEEVDMLIAIINSPGGLTLDSACQLLDSTVDVARHRINAIKGQTRLYTRQHKDPSGAFTQVRYFAHKEHCDAWGEGDTVEDTNAIPSEFGDLSKPAQRTHLEGLAPLPTFINPAPTLRDGADEARGLPSRRGNFLVYRDGTREPIHASA